MSLLVTIKAAQLSARKARQSADAASLSTLISEAEAVGKTAGREPTDAEVIAVLKKFIKNLDEVIRYAGDYSDGDRPYAHHEKELLEQFVPKQLSEAELGIEVGKLVAETGAASVKDMGKVMNALKAKYEGQFDGGLASKLIKTVLTVA